jgi:hypothetical protein
VRTLEQILLDADLRFPPNVTECCMEDEMTDDRSRLDIATLNELCRDFSTFNGLLLGKDGQGGVLRELQTDIAKNRDENAKHFDDLRSRIDALHVEHHQELGEVRKAVADVQKDTDNAHDRLRDLSAWRDKQQKSWGSFFDSALKLVLTVLGGVAVFAVTNWIRSML